MAIIFFDEGALLSRLALLRKRDVIVFAAACAQRIFPSYAHFAEVAPDGRSGIEAFADALGRVWASSLFADPEDAVLLQLLARCEALLPSEDDAWQAGYPYAEDAATAIVYCLRLVHSGDTQEALWVARRLYEATDNFVLSGAGLTLDQPGSEALILAHPIVQAELTRQLRDLDDLAGAQVVAGDSREMYSMIRRRAESEAPFLFKDV